MQRLAQLLKTSQEGENSEKWVQPYRKKESLRVFHVIPFKL